MEAMKFLPLFGYSKVLMWKILYNLKGVWKKKCIASLRLKFEKDPFRGCGYNGI